MSQQSKQETCYQKARRIADTELAYALKSNVFDPYAFAFGSLTAHLGNAIGENAELLAALEGAHSAMMEASGASNAAARAVSAAIHQARAAIAKAKGGAS